MSDACGADHWTGSDPDGWSASSVPGVLRSTRETAKVEVSHRLHSPIRGWWRQRLQARRGRGHLCRRHVQQRCLREV